MSITEEMKVTLDAIDTETNTIADEINQLRNDAANGIPASDAAAFNTRLGALSTRLQGIAADPANPVPPTP